jgi:hypothetical protein
VQAEPLVSPEWKRQARGGRRFAVGVGPARAGKAGVGFDAERLGGPERQACTSPRPRTGCRPNVDEILGLIAAARNAGPMPSESHEQVSDLS